MSKESIFAKQDNIVKSVEELSSNLRQLAKLHAEQNLTQVAARQKELLEPLNSGLALQNPSVEDSVEYLTDFAQRSVLFLDVLRRRADDMLADQAADYPLLLKFNYEVVMDGHDQPSPVNYSLLRILPDKGQKIDDTKQPIVVVDPRGGHGAGIGGFKKDSEIGESLRAGHPTYFISFSHYPAPGQTLSTIAAAQATYLERIIKDHPKSKKPVIIGNCQAGWAVMSLAAARPDLPGLVIINGAPLSYWSGVNGANPMRYLGGLLGGGWITRLANDLGNGRFDGAWIVSNFENLNPYNTLWGKDYNLFAKVDSEAERFLDFERWWDNPTLFNSEEMESIVDDLFIGNKLTGGASGRNSLGLNLRKITCPVIVFCSSGDNITPPQQALNWIVDLYPNDIDLHAAGRTIIYLQHDHIGHLGIFVSGTVARREHRQLINSIDAIDALPPGLYEFGIEDVKNPRTKQVEQRVHFDNRSIDDIRLKDDGRDEEKEFALVNRISEVNSNLYSWLVRPWLRTLITEPVAQAIRDAIPFRRSRLQWASTNPWMWWVPGAAELVRQNRKKVRDDNPFLGWQEVFSHSLKNYLDTYRDTRDSLVESCFHTVYGTLNTLIQSGTTTPRDITVSEMNHDLVDNLENHLSQGGVREAVMRILSLMAQVNGKIDRQQFEELMNSFRQYRKKHRIADAGSLREAARVQSLLVFADPEQSLSTLPSLLKTESERRTAVSLVEEIMEQTGGGRDRSTQTLWKKIQKLLGMDATGKATAKPVKAGGGKTTTAGTSASLANSRETAPMSAGTQKTAAKPTISKSSRTAPSKKSSTATAAAARTKAASIPVASVPKASAKPSTPVTARPEVKAPAKARVKAPKPAASGGSATVTTPVQKTSAISATGTADVRTNTTQVTPSSPTGASSRNAATIPMTPPAARTNGAEKTAAAGITTTAAATTSKSTQPAGNTPNDGVPVKKD